MADETKKRIGAFKVQGVLSFPHIFSKSASIENGPMKFRTSVLFDKGTSIGKKNYLIAKNAREEMAVEKWEKVPALKDGRDALFDGDTYVDDEDVVRQGYEDRHALKMTADKAPKIYLRNGNRVTKTGDVFAKGDKAMSEAIDSVDIDDLFYGGAIVNIWGSFYPIDDKKRGGRGIFASFDAVQFVEHGERFGGGGISDDEIDDLDEDEGGSSKNRKKPSDDDDEDEQPKRKKARPSYDDDDIPL